jgi:pyridoxal phosphate enzyme (YggS family)
LTAERISTPVPTPVVLERLQAVRRRIEAAGGDPERVRILAVTKGFGAWAPELAASIGLVDLGENYAQELLAKAAEVQSAGGPPVRWHAIGRLQRNKVKSLAPVVSCWQSIDRPSLADEVARRAPGASVLVQVNVSGEEQKGGVAPTETSALVDRCRAGGLQVDGLMAVGATGGPEAARPGFALLRHLADELGLPERSMGMSGDLEAAVAEGATTVRVGTALFGKR